MLGLTLTTGFVLFNIRTLYSLLGSLLFTTPLWSQFDMLKSLDEMKKRKAGACPLKDDLDDEDRLRPILG